MNRIPCEIVQDLLPSYIDELTSEVTNQAIEEHLAGCETCKNIYEEMKAPEGWTPTTEVKELDFLKKTKKKHRSSLILCAVIAFACAVVLLGVRYYLTPQRVNPESLDYQLGVSGHNLSFFVDALEDFGIRKVNMDEEDGIVKLSLACVPKSIFSRHSVNASYECEEEIRQVWLGDRILWSEGEEITTLAASLLEAYNPYVGDMPANNRVARALNISAYTGEFTNELQTAEEPYGWKMILKKDFPESRQEAVEERLTQYAYFCLADIGNLGQVEFVYSLGGQPVSLIVTADQATAYVGADIKAVGRDIKRLNALVEKIGWFW